MALTISDGYERWVWERGFDKDTWFGRGHFLGHDFEDVDIGTVSRVWSTKYTATATAAMSHETTMSKQHGTNQRLES